MLSRLGLHPLAAYTVAFVRKHHALPRPLANLLALPPLLAAGSFALTDSLFWPVLLYLP
jgi:hypothetical protein